MRPAPAACTIVSRRVIGPIYKSNHCHTGWHSGNPKQGCAKDTDPWPRNLRALSYSVSSDFCRSQSTLVGVGNGTESDSWCAHASLRCADKAVAGGGATWMAGEQAPVLSVGTGLVLVSPPPSAGCVRVAAGTTGSCARATATALAEVAGP